MDITSLIIFIAVNLVLAVLFGFIFGKTGILEAESKKIAKWLKWVIGIIVFGAMSICGTLFGVSFDGPIMNARDFAPVTAGVWFGPVIGIGAAIVGAVFRSIIGGASVVPCCISTILAGVLGSLVYLFLKKNSKKTGIIAPALTAAVVGLIHMLLLCLLIPNGAGVAIAFGVVGIGTLASIVVCSFVFSLTYKLSSAKKAEN
ncbi:MAG: LytS/YhcK type 5TM receptor domain-containing protein [Methanocorpusculum sp.]|nr:LytS/YhcK type 5TM receptor domain-containing protein [Methanocorpusculum sp.]